jgi:serine phosphatase RsbU (regulator of sigma subunit)
MGLEDQRRMQCMEVWGGNEAANASVVMPGLDAWVFSEPHGESASGGDVHYVSSCASGRITRFLLADVRGHGEPVSDLAVSLRTIMRRYINFIDQSEVVSAINDEFKHLGESGLMATAVAGTFFLPTRKLTLSNAGHPPPLVYRRKTAAWETLEFNGGKRKAGGETTLSNVPLGLFSEVHWQKVQLPMQPGDLALMFTDSLIEIPVGEDEQLGSGRLLEIVRGLDPERPEELIRELLSSVREAADGSRFEDDTSVMLVRANNVGTRTVDDLLSPFRYLADFVRLRLLRSVPS